MSDEDEFTFDREVIESKPIKELEDTIGLAKGDRVRLVIEGNIVENPKPVKRAGDGSIELVKVLQIDRVRDLERISRL